MEVYAPIPAEVVRRSQRRDCAWVVGSVVLLLAVGIAVGTRLQWTSPPNSRNFGTVQTRFGTVGVVCGGDAAPRCGEATGLAFKKCTPALRDYFGGYFGDDQDARVRTLIGKTAADRTRHGPRGVGSPHWFVADRLTSNQTEPRPSPSERDTDGLHDWSDERQATGHGANHVPAILLFAAGGAVLVLAGLLGVFLVRSHPSAAPAGDQSESS